MSSTTHCIQCCCVCCINLIQVLMSSGFSPRALASKMILQSVSPIRYLGPLDMPSFLIKSISQTASIGDIPTRLAPLISRK